MYINIQQFHPQNWETTHKTTFSIKDLQNTPSKSGITKQGRHSPGKIILHGCH